MTLDLRNGDCLEVMKTLEDKSIDLIFCDLPYGQTSCKWDCCIDIDEFWKQVMRVKKLNTPIFMTTTTKFGVSLINSAPKKCPFRYDIVWVKSAPAGFLSAKKMPMRKHEMVYVFYEKLPFYDLSSHTHKFLKKEGQMVKDFTDNKNGNIYDCPDNQEFKGRNGQPRYDPPLPVSVVKEGDKYCDEIINNNIIKDTKYGTNTYNTETGRKKPLKHTGSGAFGGEGPCYDPPLPTSMLEIKSTRGKHSTEKPVALMEWVFKYYSKEGNTILDPTMGSGSTGVACRNMNRNFIGIEMDEDIFKTAFARLG
tara:strand:+ start:1100 stop:2023 length:924 start_codon:yes stop_codon:yes gene_type:complete